MKEKMARPALFSAVVGASFAAVIIRSIDAPALVIAFYRLLFTSLFLLPWVLRYSSSFKQVNKNNLIWMALIGFVLTLHFAFWVESLNRTSVAVSVILVTSHPFFVAPLSVYLLQEKLTRVNIIGVVLAVLGVIVLVFNDLSISNTRLSGSILALLGGIMAGIYIMAGRRFRKELDIVTYALPVYLFATLFLFISCLIFRQSVFSVGREDMGLIMLMAVLSGIIGHTLFNWSLKYVRAATASVALVVEPIGSTIWAFLILDESIGWVVFLAGGLTLLGIYLAISEKKKEIAQ